MSIMNGAWAHRGWGEKCVALAGLFTLSALSRDRAAAVFPAMVGTAWTLMTLANAKFSLGRLVWLLTIEFLFGGLASLMIGSATSTPMAPWFIGSLAMLVTLQDDRRSSAS